VGRLHSPGSAVVRQRHSADDAVGSMRPEALELREQMEEAGSRRSTFSVKRITGFVGTDYVDL